MSEPKYGDPFLTTVMEGNLSGDISSADIEGHSIVGNEAGMIQGMRDDVEQHGGAMQLYICIPVGRVWATDDDKEDGPYKVDANVLDTEIERMMAVAAAIGGK